MLEKLLWFWLLFVLLSGCSSSGLPGDTGAVPLDIGCGEKYAPCCYAADMGRCVSGGGLFGGDIRERLTCDRVVEKCEKCGENGFACCGSYDADENSRTCLDPLDWCRPIFRPTGICDHCGRSGAPCCARYAPCDPGVVVNRNDTSCRCG